ncbi:hypothetical protein [Leeuwenhoekiella palythoae]|uniref:KTSC domain-containing protein n=1 Tax=Leeuwenhoekiella palythoae TaxID=573501 RepID=A0A1M5YUZ4_9FLAO|nr:hypothetical protein [Leeuwenhoekiella palythoae]MEC7784796.1 hypothetical protein [Bacteroidota bacterium]RXG29560.1 hypothetical protein DSM01_1662 [Leeuwenhoekiella palythoae]UBZ11406.1 hypothetical protein LDL79_04635 [Leeuwenhoekiella palythoae]SHI15841.1 hypothetical protein SAMN04487999_2387 [Leeuwenhoekiella palythoae]
MIRYQNRNRDSGVAFYELLSNGIVVHFTTGAIYEYTYATAGKTSIDQMKKLAESGSGLNSYINQNVKYKYSRKIR